MTAVEWVGRRALVLWLVGCAALIGSAGWAAPQDDMADRVLPCTACHGKEGRATPGGYFPRIAGKPAGYLYHQLLNFRDGRRSYPQMGDLLLHLSDAYLQEIATYFSQWQLPYAAPVPSAAAPEVLQRGKQLVYEGDAAKQLPACARCHGAQLMGVAPAVPGLLGLSRDYLVSQLGAWRTGLRHAQEPDCMAQLSQRLSLDEVQALAHWLSSQPVPPGTQPQAASHEKLPLRCGSVQEASGAPMATATPVGAGRQP